MENSVQIAGRTWYIGKVKRDRNTLTEQIESLAEDYEGFEWIGVSQGIIKFYYLRKKEGVAV